MRTLKRRLRLVLLGSRSQDETVLVMKLQDNSFFIAMPKR